MKETYGEQLDLIANLLKGDGFSPSVRGEDMGRFVYAEHQDRAAEVYWDGVAFMIELFEQPTVHSVRDYHQDTPEIAAGQAIDWLLRRSISN